MARRAKGAGGLSKADVIVEALQRRGIDFHSDNNNNEEDDAAGGSDVIEMMSPAQYYSVVRQCLGIVLPNKQVLKEIVKTLPVEMPSRIRNCSKMADLVVKELGYKAPSSGLGYHSFLYSSSLDREALLEFLLSKFKVDSTAAPSETAEVGDDQQTVTPRMTFKGLVERRRKQIRQLKPTVFLPPYLQPRRSDLSTPGCGLSTCAYLANDRCYWNNNMLIDRQQVRSLDTHGPLPTSVNMLFDDAVYIDQSNEGKTGDGEEDNAIEWMRNHIVHFENELAMGKDAARDKNIEDRLSNVTLTDSAMVKSGDIDGDGDKSVAKTPMEELEERIHELRDRVTALNNEKRALDETAKTLTQQLEKVREDAKTFEKGAEELTKEFEAKLDDVRDLHQRFAADDDAGRVYRAALLEEVAKREAKMASIRRKWSEDTKPGLLAELRTLQESSGHFEELTKCRERLRALQEEMGRVGSETTDVRKQIERQRRLLAAEKAEDAGIVTGRSQFIERLALVMSAIEKQRNEVSRIAVECRELTVSIDATRTKVTRAFDEHEAALFRAAASAKGGRAANADATSAGRIYAVLVSVHKSYQDIGRLAEANLAERRRVNALEREAAAAENDDVEGKIAAIGDDLARLEASSTSKGSLASDADTFRDGSLASDHDQRYASEDQQSFADSEEKLVQQMPNVPVPVADVRRDYTIAYDDGPDAAMDEDEIENPLLA